MALFLFLLAKAAPAYLIFQQAQYVQVSFLKPVSLYKLFAGLGSINKSATSFLLRSDSHSALATLSSIPSFLLPQSLWQIWQELSSLPSCSIRLQWVLKYCFSQETTWLMSWPDEEHYLCPLQSLVVSLLLSLISTLLFSQTGGIQSHQNFLTHMFPQFPLRNLCSLIMLAVFSLVYAATNTAFC